MNLRFATIAPAAERRIRDLAAAAYPHEGCGVLLGRRDGTRMVIVDVTSARNMWTERAADRYDLDPVDFMKADRDGRSRGPRHRRHLAQPSRPSGPAVAVRHRSRMARLHLHHLPDDDSRRRGYERLRARRVRVLRSVRSRWTFRPSPAGGDEPGRRHSPAPPRRRRSDRAGCRSRRHRRAVPTLANRRCSIGSPGRGGRLSIRLRG